jgi:hypothetical protein
VNIDVRFAQPEHQIVDPHLAHLPQRPAPHGAIVRAPSLRPPHLVQVLPGLKRCLGDTKNDTIKV